MINEFPVAQPNGTIQVNACPFAIPDVRKIPHQRAHLRWLLRCTQQRNERLSVERLRHLNLSNTRHFEQRGIKILDDDGRFVARVRSHFARPPHDERHPNATLIQRPFATFERRILRVGRAFAPRLRRRQPTIVAHEDENGALGLTIRFQPAHHIAQTLVHPRNQRRISRRLVRQPFAHILRIKAHVLVDGNVQSIVRQIQIKRLLIAFRLVQRPQSLLRQRLGGKRSRAPIALQTGDGVERQRPSVARMTIVSFTQIGRQTACRTARDIDFETKMARIFTRRVYRSPMRFAAMNGVVARILQQLHKRKGLRRTLHPATLRNAVAIPIGQNHALLLPIRRLVALQSPVRHPVPRHIHARHQAAPRRRTHRSCIGIGKQHARPGQSFHVGRVVHAVVIRHHLRERHRRVLPPHVVHHEQNNIGSALLVLCIERSDAHQGHTHHCTHPLFLHFITV